MSWGVLIPLVLTGLLYGRGRGSTSAQRAYFWTGWCVLTLALISPLHELSERFFSAHMLQHEILMLVAAPLLVLSRPLAPFLHSLPFAWRRRVGRWLKLPALISPFAAWLIHAAALWIWHYPPLFEATLTSEWVHAAQHISFLGSALLFWWALFHARGRNSYGTGVLYIFTTGIHTGILGALLTLSPRIWYPAYHTPLEDQQLGGLIMWVPASVVYLGAALVMFGQWMKRSEAYAG